MTSAAPPLPSVPALPAETIASLKRRHIAFLEARLVSDAAREDWARSLEAGWSWLLTLRLREIVDVAELERALVRALSADSVITLFSPVARAIHERALAAVKADETKLAAYVDAEARAAIDALVERSDLVPETLIREIFAQTAVEEALRDILFDGLGEFNQTVNPFFAEWGLPALLRKMPIGGGAIAKSMGALKGEFDKRLEPETRKFLQVFARKACGKLADFAISRRDDPQAVALRKNVVSFLYGQSLAELLRHVDDDARRRADAAIERVALGLLRHEAPRTRVRAALDAFFDEHGERSVGEWLTLVGATGRPELDAWAELTWPHVRKLLESPVGRDFFARVVAEFYDALETLDEGGAPSRNGG